MSQMTSSVLLWYYGKPYRMTCKPIKLLSVRLYMVTGVIHGNTNVWWRQGVIGNTVCSLVLNLLLRKYANSLVHTIIYTGFSLFQIFKVYF